MNRTDLEYIRDFDSSAQNFMGFGIFLLGGGSWLGVEKAFESLSSVEGFSMDPIIWLCVGCVFVGGFLWYQGYKMASKKASHIQRIFDETKEIAPQNDIPR